MRLVGVANVLQHLSIEAPSTSENYGPATLLTFEFVSTNSERMQRFFVELLVSRSWGKEDFSLNTQIYLAMQKPIKGDLRKAPEIDLSADVVIDSLQCVVTHLLKDDGWESNLSRFLPQQV